MHKQVSYLKVTEHKGAKRLWLEGLYLGRCGFTRGARYRTVLDMEAGHFRIELHANGDRQVSGRLRNEREIPIIDLCSADIRSLTGDHDRVRVMVADGTIVVSLHHFDLKRLEREDRLREHVENGMVTEGTLCAGGGISTAALKDGLTDEGIATRVEWVVDREPSYLGYAMERNPSVADAQVIEAALEELEPQLLTKVDVLNMSLPCTGHSLSGKSKNKIAVAEEHSSDATAMVGALNLIPYLQPSIIVSENVKEARHSASYLLLKAALAQWGYQLHEWILDETHAGTLEARERYWLVAISDGLPEFNPDDLRSAPRQYANLGAIMEPVADDDPSWSDNQYLKDKAIRDSAAGKGFATRQLLTADSPKIGTIGRGYAKRRSTEGFFTRDDGKERLLTPLEHARVKGIPDEYAGGGYGMTLLHEVFGQSILYPHARQIGSALGRYLHKVVNLGVIQTVSCVTDAAIQAVTAAHSTPATAALPVQSELF